MKMWVVMGNDYPCGVFSTEEKADDYVRQKKNQNSTDRVKDPMRGRIYYRHYEFEVDADV